MTMAKYGGRTKDGSSNHMGRIRMKGRNRYNYKLSTRRDGQPPELRSTVRIRTGRRRQVVSTSCALTRRSNLSLPLFSPTFRIGKTRDFLIALTVLSIGVLPSPPGFIIRDCVTDVVVSERPGSSNTAPRFRTAICTERLE